MAKQDKKPPVGKNGVSPAVQGGTVEVGGQTFKRKLITLPHKKFADSVPMLVEPLAVMYKGQEQLDRKTGEPLKDEKGDPKEPVDMMKCRDLTTGEAHTIIVGAVLKERLNENYPDGGYVGKKFEFTQHKVDGKRWKDYAITELE